MRIGSLFSGIGGLELGLEWAGVGRTVWQVEREPFCREVLAKHWPDAERFDDVTKVGAHNLAPVEVICGGYPCQPFSVQGQQQGADDERHLWPEFARILRELRPRFAVLENVPNHLALGFGDVLRDLAACGMDAEWRVLRAGDVGAPHRRERLFVVAYSAAQRREARDSVFARVARRHSAASAWDVEPTRALRGGLRALPKPGILRMGYGVSHRMDGRGGGRRIGALGNAVVPQVAELVGRRLMEIAGDTL